MNTKPEEIAFQVLKESDQELIRVLDATQLMNIACQEVTCSNIQTVRRENTFELNADERQVISMNGPAEP